MRKELSTPEKAKIYFASPLFNGGHTILNRQVKDFLEIMGHQVFLPQRDGYEFASLSPLLAANLPSEAVAEARQTLILLRDLGYAVPRSDALVIRLDEPIDPGASDEVAQADMMCIPTVGFRTDVRSPYGNLSEPLGGIHFFPACRCRVFIRHPMSTGSHEEIVSLVVKISEQVQDLTTNSKTSRWYSPKITALMEYANLLFDGVADIHSREGLETIIARYLQNKEVLQKLMPRVV